MTNQTQLSERQTKIVSMIRDYVAEYDYPPSIREIGEAVGLSSASVVSYNRKVLEQKGYLVRSREVSRGLRLAEPGWGEFAHTAPALAASPSSMVHVPMLGVIAAGEPIAVPDDLTDGGYDTLAMSTDLVKSTEQVYALEVHGTSMIGDLINDGDIVVLRHQETANNGDTVAAWLKDEKSTTLKRFYRERGGALIRLQPANPTMEPIYVQPENLEIQGKVICVVRRLG
jgi:repressor LexA